jgi:S1-C subfamily serine protease
MQFRVVPVAALVSGAALAVSVALPAAALDGFAVYQAARPHLVQVVGISAEGRYHVGSGVALSNGTVVTNCHVTLQAKRVQLFLGGGNDAALQSAHVAHDLCALYFADLKRTGATLGTTRGLHVGDAVYAVGFNAGRGLTYQPGEITELYELEGGMVVRTSAPFTHGASGGGLFDSDGRLIGILTFFRVSKDKTDYFAVPVEWLAALDSVPAAPIAPLAGVPFWAEQIGRQPAFLRAGALEADGRWEELAAMARDWTGAAPDDGNAWLALAKAAAQLGDSVVADDALRRAAELGVVQPAKMQSH